MLKFYSMNGYHHIWGRENIGHPIPMEAVMTLISPKTGYQLSDELRHAIQILCLMNNLYER